MKNFLTRLVVGIALTAFVAAVIWIGGWWCALIAAAVGVIAVWECGALFAPSGEAPLMLVYPFVVVLTVRSMFPYSSAVFEGTVTGALVLGIAWSLMGRTKAERWMATLGLGLYVGVALGYFVALVNAHDASLPHEGIRLVGTMVAAIIACDTGAYAVGMLAGRHRLATDISPKKSVEGAVGGFVAASVVGMIGCLWFLHMTALESLGFGALVGVVAQVGDLAESWMKRQARVKDSSSLIPGHGGVMDRLDSVVLVVPVIYWYVRWLIGA